MTILYNNDSVDISKSESEKFFGSFLQKRIKKSYHIQPTQNPLIAQRTEGFRINRLAL